MLPSRISPGLRGFSWLPRVSRVTWSLPGFPGHPQASLSIPGLPGPPRVCSGLLGPPRASPGLLKLPWALPGLPGPRWASLGIPGPRRADLGSGGPIRAPQGSIGLSCTSPLLPDPTRLAFLGLSGRPVSFGVPRTPNSMEEGRGRGGMGLGGCKVSESIWKPPSDATYHHYLTYRTTSLRKRPRTLLVGLPGPLITNACPSPFPPLNSPDRSLRSLASFFGAPL